MSGDEHEREPNSLLTLTKTASDSSRGPSCPLVKIGWSHNDARRSRDLLLERPSAAWEVHGVANNMDINEGLSSQLDT